MSFFDINSSVLISFFVLFDIGAFKSKFNIPEHARRSIFKWDKTAAALDAKNMERMELKCPRSKSAQKESQFLINENVVLSELETGKKRQVFRAALGVHM